MEHNIIEYSHGLDQVYRSRTKNGNPLNSEVEDMVQTAQLGFEGASLQECRSQSRIARDAPATGTANSQAMSPYLKVVVVVPVLGIVFGIVLAVLIVSFPRNQQGNVRRVDPTSTNQLPKVRDVPLMQTPASIRFHQEKYYFRVYASIRVSLLPPRSSRIAQTYFFVGAYSLSGGCLLVELVFQDGSA